MVSAHPMAGCPGPPARFLLTSSPASRAELQDQDRSSSSSPAPRSGCWPACQRCSGPGRNPRPQGRTCGEHPR
eukprot:scaffold26111_cov112-Isochrysis_galbana.AAC.3